MARILIIDDDTQIRVMLRQMLERERYEVIDAPDGEEGIKTLSGEASRPDYYRHLYA